MKHTLKTTELDDPLYRKQSRNPGDLIYLFHFPKSLVCPDCHSFSTESPRPMENPSGPNKAAQCMQPHYVCFSKKKVIKIPNLPRRHSPLPSLLLFGHCQVLQSLVRLFLHVCAS